MNDVQWPGVSNKIDEICDYVMMTVQFDLSKI